MVSTGERNFSAEIQSSLELMRDNPKRTDKPLIYHLDVAAMYPNIMLSNRLQPDSVADESTCAVCGPDKTCDRRLNEVAAAAAAEQGKEWNGRRSKRGGRRKEWSGGGIGGMEWDRGMARGAR
jgi:DNA polymerase elongation subunit (family B)